MCMASLNMRTPSCYRQHSQLFTFQHMLLCKHDNHLLHEQVHIETVQWNLSNPDTLGIEESVLISDVS